MSSTLNRDTKQFGKKFLFDGREETCWNSDQVLIIHSYAITRFMCIMKCIIVRDYLKPLTESTLFREAPNGYLLSLNTLWLCLRFVFNFKVKITILNLTYSLGSPILKQGSALTYTLLRSLAWATWLAIFLMFIGEAWVIGVSQCYTCIGLLWCATNSPLLFHFVQHGLCP